MTYDDMMIMLKNYQKDRGELEVMCASMGIRSPTFSDEPHGYSLPKDQQYNRAIIRMNELVKRIRYIERCVNKLKGVDEDYFRIIYHRWLHDYYPDKASGHMSLEEIAKLLLHIDYNTMLRKNLYSKSKEALLEIMSADVMECRDRHKI